MKTYNTGKNTWEHGRVTSWHPNRNPERWLLGPCPQCGSVTSNYGLSFSCHNSGCHNSANVFACGPEPEPDWWNSDLNVFLDGDKWCATGKGFENLQESHAGFGDTPRDAVANLHLVSRTFEDVIREAKGSLSDPENKDQLIGFLAQRIATLEKDSK